MLPYLTKPLAGAPLVTLGESEHGEVHLTLGRGAEAKRVLCLLRPPERQMRESDSGGKRVPLASQAVRKAAVQFI
jgi:hypothetical protein